MRVQSANNNQFQTKTQKAPAFGGKIVFHADNFEGAVKKFSDLMCEAVNIVRNKGVRASGKNLSEGIKGLAIIEFDTKFNKKCKPVCDEFSKKLEGTGITATFEESAK